MQFDNRSGVGISRTRLRQFAHHRSISTSSILPECQLLDARICSHSGRMYGALHFQAQIRIGIPMTVLSRPLPSSISRQFSNALHDGCSVLVIDVGGNCTRLIVGFGAGVVVLSSIAAARERLLSDVFDAVLLVASGFGEQAVSVGEIESIIGLAKGLPVLLIVETDDGEVGRRAIIAGAVEVFVRGTVGPLEIKRRTLQAIELFRLRAYCVDIDEALDSNARAVFIAGRHG